MKFLSLLFLAFLVSACATPPQNQKYFGLTQSQLAAKIGFPLKTYTLNAKALGGPGVLFWVYYQKSPSGTIEEKEFSFSGTPLRVNSTSADIEPRDFLSLEKNGDFQEIFKYNLNHGL